MTHALFPGSFDPITVGHLDLIQRAARMFDKVTVAILHNSAKKGTFTLDERLEMLKIASAEIPNVEVAAFEGLTVRYAEQIGANVMLRGLRSTADLEYEKVLAFTNAGLAPSIETVFLLTNPAYGHISSTIVRELASYGADFSGMVPSSLYDRIAAHYAQKK